MSKIAFTYSGKWDDVRKHLRHFPTNEVLKKINEISYSLLLNFQENDLSATHEVIYTILNKDTGKPEKKSSIVTAWSLIDLAYYAICASNDHRGNYFHNDDEFYSLYDVVVALLQRNEKNLIHSENFNKNLFLYLWGFAGEQFKFQRPIKIFDNAGRELYILFECAKKISDESICVPSIVQKETGYCWEKIVTSLLLGFYYFSNPLKYSKGILPLKKEGFLRDNEFKNIMQRYSINYKDVRESSLKRQVFYTKPYVITQKNELIGFSSYLNLFIYEHCILWIVRDYYKQKNNQTFTNFFGKCFEVYFEELLDYYLDKKEFVKIPEDKKEPRADWKLEIGEFRFLVEQKSTIIRLGAKQQESSIDDIKEFAKKTIQKAIKQLNFTESMFEGEKFIKVILLYEDYLDPEILSQVFNMEDFDIPSDDYYWLVSIDEMERLLSLCKENRDKFNSVIRKKIDLEVSHSIEGKQLHYILDSFGITSNNYIMTEKIKYYRDRAYNLSKMCLRNDKVNTLSKIVLSENKEF